MGGVREKGVLVEPGKKPAGGGGTHRCMQSMTVRWCQGESVTEPCYNLIGVAGIPKGGLHAGQKPCTDLTLISKYWVGSMWPWKAEKNGKGTKHWGNAMQKKLHRKPRNFNRARGGTDRVPSSSHQVTPPYMDLINRPLCRKKKTSPNTPL